MVPGSRVASIFTLEAAIGTGGMATVHRARDDRTNTLVALKIVKSDVADPRFDLEARLLASLDDPRIVRYLDHGVDGDVRWIAMEWLDGHDLAVHLRRARPTVAESLGLASDVAFALATAHARGIVHRDLKPSNVFLVGAGLDRPKVIDFGVALDTLSPADVTNEGAAVGSPGYMAPEQARGDAVITPAADLFSLGCVLFECLAGRPAFQGRHVMAILAKILLEPAPNPAEVSADVSIAMGDLVVRLLAKDPADRPSSALDVARELAALRDEASTNAERARSRPPAALPQLSATELSLVSVLAIGRAASHAGGAPLASGAALERIGAAATAHGATYDVLANDTVVVTLRGPVATDLAARAASCALTLHDAVPAAAMGLATGRADLGAPGAARRAPVGESIDRAVAAMKRSAFDPERAIHVDDVSDGLLDHRFTRRRTGDRRILLGFHDVDTDRLLLGKPTPFVGRDAEVALLESLVDRALGDGGARAAVVIAPPGAGKSRLRRELTARAMARASPEIWLARADSMGVRPAYALVGQLVRVAARVRDVDPVELRREKIRDAVAAAVGGAEAVRVAAFLAETAGAGFPSDAHVELAAARRDPTLMADQIRRAWEAFVVARTRVGPLVVLLEDLQWSDRPSVALVDVALRACRDAPLVVLGFARPEVDAAHPRLFEERGAHRVVLAPLGRKAAMELVTSTLGPLLGATGGAVEPALVSLLVEQAAGNALFLEELIRAAFEHLASGPRPPSNDLPETVVAMLEARIGALPPSARRVLRSASVFGQVLWRGAVAGLVGDEAAATVDADLELLVDREIFARRWTTRFPGEAEYAFRHGLVREAAYAMLTEDDRALGHALAGAWLERAGEGDALVLAEHFERGDTPERALHYLLGAATDALAMSDFTLAIELAARGYGCGASGEALGKLLYVQAEAHKWRGDNAEAEARGLRALEWLRPGSDAWFGAAGEVVVASLRLGRVDRIGEVVERIRAVAPDAMGTSAVLAIARAATGLVHAGETVPADDLFALLDRSVPPGSHLEPIASARVAQARGTRALVAGDLAGYLDAIAVAAVGYEAVGDLRLACNAHVGLGWALGEVGELDKAARVLSAALDEATRLGLVQLGAAARTNLGQVRALEGDFAGAIEELELAAATLGKQGDRRMESAARAYLARAHVLASDLAKAEEEADHAATVAPAPPARARALAAQAEVALARGDASTALHAAEEAMEIVRAASGIDSGEAFVRLVHVRALDAVGRRADAAAAAREARAGLEAAAQRIRDLRRRAAFLERVEDHRRTLALAAELEADPSPGA